MTTGARTRGRPAVALLVVSGIALALALACYLAAARAVGDLPAYVHVRWAADMDADARMRLERQFSLSAPALKDGTTYGYNLTDVSETNLRQLVQHRAVVDTNDIDREAFRILPTAQRLRRDKTGAALPPTLVERLVTPSLTLGATTLTLGMFFLFAPTTAGRAWRATREVRLGPSTLNRWVSSCVPEATAQAVALFRIVFGVGVVALLTMYGPASANAPGVVGPWITPWLVTFGVLFTAGVFSRTAYIGLLAGVVAWTAATQPDSHPYAAFLVVLICLLPSRWGDAWSVDAWRRRRQGQAPFTATPRQYGYTVWVPSMVMGVLFAAAAIAKLQGAGFAWIANGTVKYHFLTDASRAPVDWGSRLAAHDSVAVLLSFGAIATEALLLPAVLSGRYWLRAVAGIAAAGLLVGFYLFQGVFWPGWWLLLLGFLPWQHIGHAPQQHLARIKGGLSPFQLAMLVALVLQQIVVSALTLEVKPLLSTYDMYSTTYGSPAEYEENSSRFYKLVGREHDGRAVACDVTANEAQNTAVALQQNRAGGAVVERCFPQLASIASVTVEVLRADVDWERWRLRGEKLVILAGPSPVAVGH